MQIEPTPLEGLLVIRPTPVGDARGHFVRLWCAEEFARAGLAFRPVQISASFNHRAGTLRGMHWQADPHAETKLVRASRGRVFDVAVDLRRDSATYRRWFGIELRADTVDAVLIPAGFAHGFVTLTDDAEVTYCIDTAYAPRAARGVRFDDPALGIEWPVAPSVLSDRDLAWPPLESG